MLMMKHMLSKESLAREGLYGSAGGLQTSGREAGGLDHARSRLLDDDRVIVEFGQTSSLEARKEILDLLQAAMGENLTSSVNAGLDEDHDSILAPGSLSRALNDFGLSMIYP